MTEPRDYLNQVISSKEYSNILHLLQSAGSLAPSTHNTQPWLVETDNHSLRITPDLTKRIPQADKVNRYLHISVGAYAQNVVEALVALKIKYDLTVNSTGVIDIRFDPLDKVSGKVTTDLKKTLIVIITRQNFRGFYEESTEQKKKDLKQLLTSYRSLIYSSDKSEISSLADLTAKGLQLTYKNELFRKEIANLINTNWSSKRYGMHGHSLRMNSVQSFIVPKILRRKDIGKKLGDTNRLSFGRADFACMFWLEDSNDNIRHWTQTGMQMEKLFLQLTSDGWAASIYVASLETKNTLAQVKRVFGAHDNQKPQIIFTIGVAPDTLPYSSRKYIEELHTN